MKITNKLIIWTLLGFNCFSAFSQVVADFTADKTEGCPPLDVTFTNRSTGTGNLSYLWTFEIGQPDNTISPQRLFNSPGTYLVTLKVTDETGATNSKSIAINVLTPPIAEFSADFTKGCTPFSPKLSDQSTKGDAEITGWLWDFRNGVTSTQKSPQATYNTEGTFSILLTVTDNNGCKNTIEKKNYIDVANKPNVSFVASPSTACKVPATINFKNYSTGKGTLTYAWDFGNTSTGASKDPMTVYDNFGTYNVSLKVTSSYGCSNSLIAPAVNITKIDAIGELTQNSRILATADYACASEIQFTNKSAGTSSVLWDFGDGTLPSYDANPKHTYTKAGTFTAKLIASPGNLCADTAKWVLTIEKPEANFSYTPENSCYEPILVNFNNLSTNATSYLWTFHDNSTKTDQNTSYTYTMNPDKDPYVVHTTRNFPVTLKATSVNGCVSSVTKNFKIGKPTALFSADTVQGCAPLTVNFTENSISPEEQINLRKWIYGDGKDNTTTISTSQHIYAEPGIYNAKLVVSTVNCRDTSYDLTIKVGKIPEPDFQITSATPFYSSQPITINDLTPANNNIDYWKYSINGENVTTCPNSPNISYKYKSDIGSLPVTLTVGSNGCYRSKTVDNAITSLGPIGSFTYNIDCASPLVYNFTGNQKGATSYKWEFGDGNTSTTLSPSHTYAVSGNYLVKFITYRDADQYSDTVSQIIYARQPNAQFSMSAEVCANSLVKMDGAASHPIFSACRDKLVWDFGDGSPKVVSGSDTVLHIFKQRGSYNVALTALYENGCTSNITKTITVYQPYAVLKADTTKGCTGLVVNFTDNSTPDTHSLTTTTWNFADGSTEETSTVRESKEHPYILPMGQYSYSFPATITIKDNFGCENKDTLEIGISQPYASFTSFGSTTLCTSDSIRLIRNYPDPDSAVWNMGDGNIVRSLKNPFSYKYADAGSYGVGLTIYKYNCTAMVEMQPGYVTMQEANAHFASDTVFDCPINIPFDHDVAMSMSPVDSGRWDFGDGYTGAYLKVPQHTYKLSGKYRIKLRVHTSFGCVDTFSRVIDIKGPVGNFTANKTKACKGEEVIFTLRDTADVKSFKWDMNEGLFKEGNPLTFRFKASGTRNIGLILYGNRGEECPFTVTQPFFVDTVDAIIDTGRDTVICEKTAILLTNNSRNYTSYSWDLGNDSIPSGKNPITSYMAGNYKVRLSVVNDNNNCRDTTYKIILVNPAPALIASRDTFICVGQNVLLHSETNGDSLAWSPNKWISDIYSPNPLATPDSSVNYIVRSYYRSTGCYAEDIVAVNVQQPISFTRSPLQDTAIVIGERVLLSINPAEPYDLLWTPNTYLICPTCESNDIMPLDSITYNLSVKDKNNCFSMNTVFKVLVKDTAYYNLPDAFMPNGNEDDQKLFVRGRGIKQLLEFKIYNRWGNLVFETSDINTGWDGKFKGKDQPIDTYIYTITIETMSGNILKKKGSVLLIR